MDTLRSDADLSRVLLPEAERRLQERAAQFSVDTLTYIDRLISADLERRTFDETFAPIREDVEASGVTEAERDELFETALREVRAEPRRGSPEQTPAASSPQ
jgi:hypothetical protein